MAVMVLTRLHLFTLEQVAGRDIEPAGDRFHQLVAGDREAVHITAVRQSDTKNALAPGWRQPALR
jgi:hypothetical protein